jgi:acetyl/propionyl-CoA carboxylase alpha subunit
MYEAAVALAREIGYVGAGTVEFLVSGSGPEQEFFFLEMNTRLQVEHPVTEAVTGLDLVAWQLRVAQGEPLPLRQDDVTRDGSAIEVRLYAEDPARGYLPNTGLLHEIDTAPTPHVRTDAGVESGSEVSSFYDPMLAKVIAHAPDRRLAAARLSAHLRAMRIHGLTTNRESLVAVLEEPDFLAGATTTDYLDLHPDVLAPAPPADVRDRHLVAAALGVAGAERAGASDAELAPAGWRNVPAVREHRHLSWGPPDASDEVTVAYRRTRDGLSAALVPGTDDPFTTDGRDLGEVEVTLDDVWTDGDRAHATADVTVAGVRARHEVSRYGDQVQVDDGLWSSAFTLLPRFRDASQEGAARGPSTPVPGTVTLVHVSAGDSVTEGQTLVVLEAMKMEHRITADADGVVAEVLVEPGQAVDAHQVVVVLESAS